MQVLHVFYVIKFLEKSLVIKNLQFCNDELFYGEDAILCYSIFFDAANMRVLDECFYNYREHSSQVSKKVSIDVSEKWMKNILIIIKQ